MVPVNKAQEEAHRVVMAREAERTRAAEVALDAVKIFERRQVEWVDAMKKARELGVVINSTS